VSSSHTGHALCPFILYPDKFSYAEKSLIVQNNIVMPRYRGYRDVTATFIRRSKIPSRIYAKHQYR